MRSPRRAKGRRLAAPLLTTLTLALLSEAPGVAVLPSLPMAAAAAAPSSSTTTAAAATTTTAAAATTTASKAWRA